jgi:hypothetical protein
MHHLYWEFRFDHLMGPQVWNTTRAMARELKEAHNPILDRVLTDTLFPFPISKGIFNGLLLLHQAKQWQKMVNHLSLRFQWPLVPDEGSRELMSLSFNAITAFLNSIRKIPRMQSDPTGRLSLKQARNCRRQLSSLHRRGEIGQADLEEILTYFRPKLRQRICR